MKHLHSSRSFHTYKPYFKLTMRWIWTKQKVTHLHGISSTTSWVLLLRNRLELRSELKDIFYWRKKVGLVLNTPDSTGFCSGALISTEWIVTAGHCLHRVNSGIAILGANNVRNNAEAGQVRLVFYFTKCPFVIWKDSWIIKKKISFRQAIAAANFFTHPGWNGLRLSDDIGLVRLTTAVVPNGNNRMKHLTNGWPNLSFL